MIIVKPKASTLFSIGIFIAACLSLSGFAAHVILNDNEINWYHYVLLLGFGPLGVGLLARMIMKYKIVSLGKGNIQIRYPAQFKNNTYKLNDIDHWKETAINTAGGKYKELLIFFENKKQLDLSMQEHANYTQAVGYLKKKAGRKYRNA